MDPAAAVLSAAVVAAGSAAAVAGLIVWAGPVDAPRARGSHANPTVTSGGTAIVAGSALGLLALGLGLEAPTDLARVALAFAFAAALGLLGAVDDLFDVGAKVKLILQAMAGLAFALLVARIDALPLAPGLVLPIGVVAGVVGTALWIVVATNAVNFMDGANGLAAGCVAIVLTVLAAGGLLHGQWALAGAALAAAAACAGFLPWNLPGKRLFQGDVGALFIGSVAAGLAIVAATAGDGRATSVYLVPFALTPFLTDVLLTLTVRARRGASLLEAHRDHLYQQWLIRTGRSHAALSLRAWAITAAFGLAGVLSELAPQGVQPLLFAVGVAVCAGGWVLARRRLGAA